MTTTTTATTTTTTTTSSSSAVAVKCNNFCYDFRRFRLPLEHGHELVLELEDPMRHHRMQLRVRRLRVQLPNEEEASAGNDMPSPQVRAVKATKIASYTRQSLAYAKKENILHTHIVYIFIFQICLRTLREMEFILSAACSVWFPRLSFETKVPCNCGRSCQLHKVGDCRDPSCRHFLPLGKGELFCAAI